MYDRASLTRGQSLIGPAVIEERETTIVLPPGLRAVVADIGCITATRLEKENETDVTTKYFTPPGDRTHTNPAGAKLNAESVVIGIRALPGLKLNEYLTDEAKALTPAYAKDVAVPKEGPATREAATKAN